MSSVVYGLPRGNGEFISFYTQDTQLHDARTRVHRAGDSHGGRAKDQ